jgi:transposase
LKGAPGRGTLEKEKPPIFGMLQRTGEVVIRMLANVQQVTIAPLIRGTIAAGSVVYTDEYNIYNRLSEWGYTPHGLPRPGRICPRRRRGWVL